MRKQINNFLFTVCALSLLASCKKEKLDVTIDNRPVTENRASSTVRVINLSQFNQVIANGDTLTNFKVINPQDQGYYKYPGTSYFPKDGRLGAIWTMPQDLFNTQDKADLHLAGRFYLGKGVNQDLKLQVVNDYNNPTDYYVLPTLYANDLPAVVPIKRGVASPSKPDYFKIRVINLSGTITSLSTGLTGAQEQLNGAISLAYADGTLVDPKTSHIATTTKASEYIEVPYGTYQFRVLLDDGRQLPALGKELSQYGIIDPPTSTLPRTTNEVTNLVYTPIQTYQPGGVYTIVVAPQVFNYFINDISETASMVQNALQIITDVAPAANLTYARVQGANAFSKQAVAFKVNGKPIANAVAYGKGSAYTNLVHGAAKVEAVDASGKVLASVEQLMRPAQNYTFWLHPNQTGAPQLLVVANDLSGTLYKDAQEDASYSREQHKFYNFQRFVNLSIGNPYITFTETNGQASNPARINLQPGLPILEQPYVHMDGLRLPYEVLAYRSKPNVVPGVWAKDIQGLSSSAFIANEDLYLKAGRKLPIQEMGIYTVALIGKTGDNVSAEEKAQLIIIKHNK